MKLRGPRLTVFHADARKQLKNLQGANKTQLGLFLGAMLAILPPATASAEQALTVTVTGFRNTQGTAHIVVYDQAKGYPTDPSRPFIYKKVVIPPQKVVVLTLPVDKTGFLAAAAYHDENGNNRMDSNFIGIPTEGTGASNNAESPFGPPKFRDARFSFPKTSSIRFFIRY